MKNMMNQMKKLAAAVPMDPGFVAVPGTAVLPTSPVMAPTAGMGGMCTHCGGDGMPWGIQISAHTI